MAQSVPPERGVSQRIVFKCDLVEARNATRLLRAFLAEQGLDDSEQFNGELCLAEACNNAIQYAAGLPTEQPIIAEAICLSAAIELRVTDHTAGFNLGGPRTTLDTQRENGRGLFIIQSLMDEVRYYRGEQGNVLVMRKTRTHQHHRPADAAAHASLDSAREQLEHCQQTISGMARELCFRSESLAAIFRCCAELGRTSDLVGFGERLMNDLLHLTTADWFVLRIVPPGGNQLEVFAASFPELHHHALPFTAEAAKAALPAELAAARTRQEVEFTSAHTAGHEPLCLAGERASGLVHPLLFGDQILGTLAIGRKNSDTPLSALQTEIIRTFAEFMAVQILNARHHEEQVHARLVAHELEIAHRIQRALLPRTLPPLVGFQLAASWESARQVGGDFYDAIPIRDHAVLLVVADVMGKGVPAAIFATITRSLLRAMAVRSHHPARLLKRLNELLYTELSSVGMFITAQLVFVDLKRRHLVAASAGHCPVVLRSGEAVRTLSVSGTPLGILPETIYQQQTATFNEAGGLLLYTDGLTESQNPAGEMFGHDRLVEWLRARPQLGTAEAIRDELTAELTRYRGGAALRDDQAMLILAAEPAAVESIPASAPSYPNPNDIPARAPDLAIAASSSPSAP